MKVRWEFTRERERPEIDGKKQEKKENQKRRGKEGTPSFTACWRHYLVEVC